MIKNEDELEDWDNFQMENDDVRHLILNYLTTKCDKTQINMTHKLECEKYHESDKIRRKPFRDGKLTYECELCIYIIQNKECINQQNCNKSHNIFEILYHPAKYRTVICDKKCNENNKKYCPFAHSTDQLRTGHIYMKRNQIMNTDKLQLSIDFDIFTFKTNKCTHPSKHNEKQCLFYHSKADRRRNPKMINYTPDSCMYSDYDKICINGDMCNRSHNKVELFYHPEKFKSKFCSVFNMMNPEAIKNCQYGGYCSFAHSEEEIRIELIHRMNINEEFFINYFKTVICPFTLSHEKATCVYSHNWQDYRRTPLKSVYRNSSCPKWDNKKTILIYKDGCPEEMHCPYSHGWKEEDFHPLNYKTKKCKTFGKTCNKTEFCPFYHQHEDKRYIIFITYRRVSQNLKEDFNHRLKQKQNNKNIYNYSTNMNNRINKSDIITRKNILNDEDKTYNINRSFINQNNKHNSFTLMNRNSLYIRPTYSSNYINKNIFNSNNSNNSFTKSFGSDNDNEIKSNFSSSSSENFTEGSFKVESIIAHQNPDDSYEFNYIGDKFDFNNDNVKKNFSTNEKSDLIENMDKTNSILKQLFKETDFTSNMDSLNINDNFGERNTSKEDLLNYLYINNFRILYDKIKSRQIDIKKIISMSDDKILKMIEFENRGKYAELRSIIMKLDDDFGGDDLLKSIDNFNSYKYDSEMNYLEFDS